MEVFKKHSLKSSNGITLISLVITVLVLLIILGFSIANITSDNRSN